MAKAIQPHGHGCISAAHRNDLGEAPVKPQLKSVIGGCYVSRDGRNWTFVELPEAKADSAVSQSKAKGLKT